MSTSTLISRFTTTVGTLITIDVAEGLISAHKESTTEIKETAEKVNSYFFGKQQIQNLLNHPDAVGIRIHFGENTEGTKKLVIFPADKNGNNLYIKNALGLDSGLDIGLPCPTFCP